jgi:hypothetical protein
LKQRFISIDIQLLRANPLAPRLLLWIALQNAIHQEDDLWQAGETHGTQQALFITPTSSLLKRLEKVSRPTYVSAIALRWAGKQQDSALALAHQLAGQLTQPALTQNFPILESLSHPDLMSFSITVMPTGLMQFELSDRGLAAWLDYLAENLRSNALPSFHSLAPSADSSQCPANLFAGQYAYARCSSLLRLAHQQSLITLANPERSPQLWQIQQPAPIPWLDTHSPLADAQPPRLRLFDIAERQLACQLLGVWDELIGDAALAASVSSISPDFWLGWANQLSQSFQRFHQRCSIWGEAGRDLPLAQVRLALLQVCQLSLGKILIDRLGSMAPTEL